MHLEETIKYINIGSPCLYIPAYGDINKKVTFNNLGHYILIQLLKNKINLIYIHEVLRHKNSKSIETFSRLSKNPMEKILDSLNFNSSIKELYKSQLKERGMR